MAKGQLPRELCSILACPVCKQGIKYSKGKTRLLCSKCKKEYMIKNGIPILLP